MIHPTLLIGAVLLGGLCGCSKPAYDTSTPQKANEAAQKMVVDGHPELLPTLIEISARDITFADGVTEASAIGEVQGKAGDMLAQLWRVSTKLKDRYGADLGEELDLSKGLGLRGLSGDFGPQIAAVLANPFGWLSLQTERLKAEDMSDGTAALLWDDQPLLGGALSMVETGDGWKFTFPIELARGTEYFPDTREEWAVVAAMMLGLEGALNEFEGEIDSGKFRNLAQAGERAGRLIGESVIAQSVIYAMMKRDAPAAP